jgi:ClpP class serine protease
LEEYLFNFNCQQKDMITSLKSIVEQDRKITQEEVEEAYNKFIQYESGSLQTMLGYHDDGLQAK